MSTSNDKQFMQGFPKGSWPEARFPEKARSRTNWCLTDDRRILVRLALQLPITVVIPENGLPVRGKTRDLSSNGVFFYANLPVVEYQEVELLMTLPNEWAMDAVRVRCLARVLRVEQDKLGTDRGIAAAIMRFDFQDVGRLV